MVGERVGDNVLSAILGSDSTRHLRPCVVGLFAHPDDEVFCVGGTIARCADAGAVTAVVSLTRGEAGQIRDAAVATRRTLGAVRAKELAVAGAALGVDRTTCLDLGDGRLGQCPLEDVAAVVGDVLGELEPDVVVTFGPDGGVRASRPRDVVPGDRGGGPGDGRAAAAAACPFPDAASS